MQKKYTLKVYPLGFGREVYRVIEISGKHSLDDLCEVILDAYNFDDDHLYEFCMDNKKFSEHSYRLESEYGRPSTRVQLDKIGLVMKQKFSLHYDFGDDWMFTITVQKIEETSEKIETKIIKEKGFVSQYIDWDEENLYEV